MNKVYLSFILLGFILLHSCSKDFIENIKSPDGLTICNVEADCDSLYLKVSYKNKTGKEFYPFPHTKNVNHEKII